MPATTPLANEIYKQLRRKLLANVFSLTYGQLAELVGKKQPIHPRSPALHKALTEISIACRNASLPCLPAVVWRANLLRPSDGYYTVAHPRSRTETSRIEAWRREHAAVLAAAERYPATFAELIEQIRWAS